MNYKTSQPRRVVENSKHFKAYHKAHMMRVYRRTLTVYLFGHLDTWIRDTNDPIDLETKKSIYPFIH